MKKRLASAMLLLLLTGGLLTGCGASVPSASPSSENLTVQNQSMYDSSSSSAGGVAMNSYSADNAAAEEAYDGYAEDELKAESGSPETQAQNIDALTLLEEKLVYHCDLEIETLEYAATVASIKDTIAKYDGIIQSESENDSSYNWYYEDYMKTGGTMHNYLQIRVPSANYDGFLAELDGVGKIISKSTNVENISQQYYDTTSQIEALKIQEKNLLSMLENCGTIEEMITVQDRLSEIQYQLNNLQTSKRYMDTDVAYSYININVTEVMEYRRDVEPEKKNTFSDRLVNTLKSTWGGFLSFLEGLLFLIIRLFPYIIIICLICLFFRKKIAKFFAARKADKETREAQKEIRRTAIMQQAEYQRSMQNNAPQQNNEINNENK